MFTISACRFVRRRRGYNEIFEREREPKDGRVAQFELFFYFFFNFFSICCCIFVVGYALYEMHVNFLVAATEIHLPNGFLLYFLLVFC